jgi:hypothetical protein
MANVTPIAKPIPAPSVNIPIRAPSAILIGQIGTGKTYSLSTILEAGLELFVIFTEPTGLETLLDALRAKKKENLVEKLHWRTIVPTTPSWTGLLDMADKLNTLGYDDLTKLKAGVSKQNTRQAITLLQTLSDFVDERTGEAFGPVENFGLDRAVAIDSLSGINVMAMDLHLGMKPVAHQGEWGAVMNFEEKLIQTLTSALKCLFVLTAHAEKETNELTGSNEVTIGALGRKLAPKIGRWFSEVVLAKQIADGKFVWSTLEPNAALKNRGLPRGNALEPSFAPLWKTFQQRLAQGGTQT